MTADVTKKMRDEIAIPMGYEAPKITAQLGRSFKNRQIMEAPVANSQRHSANQIMSQCPFKIKKCGKFHFNFVAIKTRSMRFL